MGQIQVALLGLGVLGSDRVARGLDAASPGETVAWRDEG